MLAPFPAIRQTDDNAPSQKRRLTFCRNMHLHSTTIPQPRSDHYSTIILVELETTETTCKNNILFPAAKPRGALETAGVLPAVEVVLSVVNVVSFMTKPQLNHKTARQIYRACFTARPETAVRGVSTRFQGHSGG